MFLRSPPAGRGSRMCPTTPCTCGKRPLSRCGPRSKASVETGLSTCSTSLWTASGQRSVFTHCPLHCTFPPSALRVGGVRVCPTTDCACGKRPLSSLGPAPPARPGCSNRRQKLKPWWEPRDVKGSLSLIKACGRSEYSFGCCACLTGLLYLPGVVFTEHFICR